MIHRMKAFSKIPALFSSCGRNPTLIHGLLLAGLYAAGFIHWTWFFNGGKSSLHSYDWPKEVMLLEVLKDSFREARIPFHINVSEHYQREFAHLKSGRFLGLPETNVSPQIFLLLFLKVNRFILFHNLFLYSLGFCGSLLLRRRYGISLIPFAAFFVLFNFNGYITAHLGAGHSMWSGYFLLPFFGLYILQSVEEPSSYLPPIKLAVVLFAILLQGSFHMVNWCWIFVGLLIVFNRRWWKQGLLLLGFSGLLAVFRLVPAAIAFWGFRDYFFIGGYPPLSLLEAFVVVRGPTFQWPEGMFNVARWWEYDFFISLLGLGMIAYFGIYKRFDRHPVFTISRFAALGMPLLVLTVLAIGDCYALFYNLPLPLLNSERVSSRFIVVPVTLLLALATIRMQRFWENANFGWKGSLVFALAIVAMFVALCMHSSVWNIARIETIGESHWHQPEKAIIVEQSDPVYFTGVIISGIVSLLAMTALLWFYWQLRRTAVGVERGA